MTGVFSRGAPEGHQMRTGLILAAVALCTVAAACSKKNSLYLVPGRVAEAPRTAPAPTIPPGGVQKASHVEQPQR
jgi:hypothetical protein